MENKVKLGRSTGFFESFDRRPSNKTNMHYCPGCGHGILHKLIAEAMVDLDMQTKMVFIAPVGCAVFGYYYFDCNSISVAHGRAPAVGTGIVRTNPDNFVISYQGDGDLGAIGFNNFLQAANRGENMVVCFVNNAIYGMTSGQMAPTTLIDQKTVTSPYGRSADNEGFPLKVSEMVAALTSPIYVERVALTSPKNIRQARKALRKGMQNMKDKKGFSLIEFLSGCPVNFKMTTDETDNFIEKEMIPYFPLKCFKDIADERSPIVRPKPITAKEKVKEILFENITPLAKEPVTLTRDYKLKCAGFGGQGVLSLGLMIATMGKMRGINVSWLPAYGPEMRGGTANCSVVLSRGFIGAPLVEKPNILVVLNQASMDRFHNDVALFGVVVYDSTHIELPKDPRKDIKYLSIEATKIAKDAGSAKCANAAMLGAFATILSGFGKTEFEDVFEEAIRKTFELKPEVIDMNIKVFKLAKQQTIKTSER